MSDADQDRDPLLHRLRVARRNRTRAANAYLACAKRLKRRMKVETLKALTPDIRKLDALKREYDLADRSVRDPSARARPW